MLQGDENGIEIYNRLGNSTNVLDQQYFKQIFDAAAKHKSACFSDIAEQRKKVFNNQNIYWMHVVGNVWRVDLFHKPKNELQ